MQAEKAKRGSSSLRNRPPLTEDRVRIRIKKDRVPKF